MRSTLFCGSNPRRDGCCSTANCGPLAGKSLDREVAERQALQVEASGLRDKLSAANLAAAKASAGSNTERARREGAEAKAKDLPGRLDKVQDDFDKLQAETSKPSRRRRWWHF